MRRRRSRRAAARDERPGWVASSTSAQPKAGRQPRGPARTLPAPPPMRKLAGLRVEGSNPGLAGHDLERSADWYRRVLGCERIDPDPGNWVFCVGGAVTFMLGRCPEVPPASSLGDHSYVAYLLVDAVDDFYANALEEQAEVLKT